MTHCSPERCPATAATKPNAARAIDAVVAGHICLDIKPTLDERHRGKKLGVPGDLVTIGAPTIVPGGAVGNTGLALHALGARVALLGAVGRDAIGSMMLEALRAHDPRLADHMLFVEGEGSSYCIVLEAPGTDRSFLAHPGVNDVFTAAHIDLDSFGGARLFHFGYPTLMRRMTENSGEALAAMFAKVKAAGLATSLDMSTPDPSSEGGSVDWPALLAKTLPHVDVFLPSLPEILFMLDRPLFEQMKARVGSPEVTPLADGTLLAKTASRLLQMGCAVAGLKLGDRGLYIHTATESRMRSVGGRLITHPEDWAERELLAPPFAIEPSGTTGAGDYSIAGFLWGMLQGLDLPQVMETSTASGAWRVEGKATPMRGDDLLRRIRGGWRKHPIAIPMDGGTMDAVHGLYRGPRDSCKEHQRDAVGVSTSRNNQADRAVDASNVILEVG